MRTRTFKHCDGEDIVMIENNNSYKINGEIKLEKIAQANRNVQNSKNPVPTFDVNMRVDNHTRNAILALARATANKRTASKMVSVLIENFLDKMTPQDLKVYQDFLDMLEQKDKLEYKLKNK